MANAFYTLNFTDPGKAPFIVNPLVSNGPISPNGIVLRPDALAANTTLQLLGRGHFDYGESIEQNLVYMLEHFANTSAPSYVIQGQIWYDTSISRPKIWNGTGWDVITINVAGNIDAGGNRIINLADPIDPTDAVNVEYADGRYLRLTGGTVTGAVTFGSTVGITGAVTLTSSLAIGTNVTVGGFLATTGAATFGAAVGVTGNITGSANLILNGVNSQITLPNLPLVGTDGANKAYVDQQDAATLASAAAGASVLYVAKAGDTMTGPLHITSTGSLQVDGPVTFGPGAVAIAAQTSVTGTLALNGVTTFNAALNVNNTTIQLNGGSTIDANNNFIHNVPTPLVGTDAVNKAYVDAAVSGAGSGAAPLTSGDFNAGTGVLTLHFTGAPDIIISGNMAPFAHTQDATTINLNVNPSYVDSYFREQAVNTPTFATTGEIPLDVAMQYVDQYLFQLNRGRTRQVYVVTGTETVPGTYALDNPYLVGSNRLAVYLDGVKQIASFHAVGKFNFFSGVQIASDSGLAPSTTYAFNLTVDATLYTNVSITTSAAPVITMNELVGLLGIAITSTAAAPAVVSFASSTILVSALSSGNGSIISIASPTAGTDLTTSLANLSFISASSITTTWSYHEVGAPGQASSTITFPVIPAAGQVLELINEPA